MVVLRWFAIVFQENGFWDEATSEVVNTCKLRCCFFRRWQRNKHLRVFKSFIVAAIVHVPPGRDINTANGKPWTLNFFDDRKVRLSDCALEWEPEDGINNQIEFFFFKFLNLFNTCFIRLLEQIEVKRVCCGLWVKKLAIISEKL